MRRPVVLLFVCVAVLAGAPTALGATADAVSGVDLSPFGTASARGRFTLAGVHWRGPGKVLFRTRSLSGAWSGWRSAQPEGEDRPNASSPEARQKVRWRVGNPWWVGPSDRIETRVSGRVSRVRAYLVWSPATAVPYRFVAAAGRPAIVPRVSWGADESIRRAPPTYAPALRFAIVHHTAGRSNYTREEAPAMVKAIQLYHVQSNGWNDIGYNFLVDRFGTIYEGRFGGIERNVVGAHALGFNTGSVGVAVLGTYGDAAPTKAAQDAVAKLLAWRLDVAHLDPQSTLMVTSGGSEKFAPGAQVLLRTVSGHRDTGSTACPGDAFYARLGAVAAAASAIGQPKIFGPTVTRGSGLLRFRARVSRPLAWVVSIADADGLVVASGTGSGTEVDWTWDPRSLPAAQYQWTISAGSARPATGSLRAGGATATLTLEAATATPSAITPNGDGQADVSVVTFRISIPAFVTVEIADASSAVVATPVVETAMSAGPQSITLDGSSLADGTYSVVVRARASNGSQVETVLPLVVSRVLGVVTASPALFSPNGDGRNDELTVAFDLTAPAQVTVRIAREGRWVATPLAAASLQAGSQSVTWDGTRSDGRLRDGSYDAIVEVATETGVVSFAVPFTSDTVAPLARIVSLRPLVISVPEAAELRLRINGAFRTREVRRPGSVRIPWHGVVRKVRVVAVDAAGNIGAPVVARAESGSRKPRQ